jgi:hypothetical protein
MHDRLTREHGASEPHGLILWTVQLGLELFEARPVLADSGTLTATALQQLVA